MCSLLFCSVLRSFSFCSVLYRSSSSATVSPYYATESIPLYFKVPYTHTLYPFPIPNSHISLLSLSRHSPPRGIGELQYTYISIPIPLLPYTRVAAFIHSQHLHYALCIMLNTLSTHLLSFSLFNLLPFQASFFTSHSLPPTPPLSWSITQHPDASIDSQPIYPLQAKASLTDCWEG